MTFLSCFAIDFTQPSLWYALFSIVLAPLIWNLIARLEFYTHLISRICCCNRYLGCYAVAIYVFSFSILRDVLVERACHHQPTLDFIPDSYMDILGGGCISIGFVLAFASMWQLGITGTYLGDYFGILMDERVVNFPFSILDNPMYVGGTISFLGNAFIAKSFLGFLFTVLVGVAYWVALRFEGPFTAYIYQLKAEREKTQDLKSQ